MARLQIEKSEWTGNKWPSVDIYPYQNEDFLKVLFHVCGAFNLVSPDIIDTLDGYAANLYIESSKVTALMDNWTFSIASEQEAVRDKIFLLLEEFHV
jgi:hypothetical protein